ncbi:hypothetical protein ANCDUO_00798 [Ancylostoma duodenale]|uniref:Uncharacterized protein n=1 Tax=Ancylostoma duodenale TaxID=51022 RepID=A0A0C2H4Y5_9BILA|nr:hypothetical protein ANCDUO_00798 [Ancylostoma duodenale]
MGAISELLQNIVWIPEVADDFLKIKQWYVDESLCKKIVDMLDPSQPECVHENVMELYTNLVRNTRDQMYALDVRSDILNDELQSENLLSLLTKKMLQMFWEEEKKLGETRDETIESYVSSNRLRDILELSYTLQELWGGNRRLIE